MTPLWLTLARIGEQSPHATESSFTAGQRAKWERVAAHVKQPSTARTEKPRAEEIVSVVSDYICYYCKHTPESAAALMERDTCPHLWQTRKIPPLSASGTAEMRSTTERVNHAESVADTIDEQGEAGTSHAHSNARNHGEPDDVPPTPTCGNSPASPSLPPWPIVVGGSYENGVLRTAMFKIEEIEHWRDAACLEIKRLQAIIDAAKEALC